MVHVLTATLRLVKKKGKNCRLFHPPMCHSSLQERKCTRKNCKFMHIKGTSRTQAGPEPESQNQSQSRPAAPQAPEPKPPLQSAAPQPSANPGSTTITGGNSFLDIIKAMQDQFAQMNSRLQHLDENYQRLCYQLPGPGHPLQQKYPAMQPHFPTQPLPLQPTMGQYLPYPNGLVGSRQVV